MKPLLSMVLCSAALGAIGCSGGESGSVDGGTPIAATLPEIEIKIFARSCVFSSCHGKDSPREMLSLVGPTYDALVNQPSRQVQGRVLVKPGDPEGSYLYEKITHAAPASGDRMPQLQPALSAAAIQAVRDWITEGAPR